MARRVRYYRCRRAANRPDWVKAPRSIGSIRRPLPGLATINLGVGEYTMSWTKPEFEVVEVTMEVTAYVARR